MDRRAVLRCSGLQSVRRQVFKFGHAQVRKPTHPGAILREDVLPHLGLTVSTFARSLGISRHRRPDPASAERV